jgi:hypothetical protein
MTTKLEQVDEYVVPTYLIERVAKQYGYSSGYTEELAREAKRMLYLTVLSDEPVVPSHNVDMVWHEMIVFTRWYHDFCEFIGSSYIHHDPDRPDDVPGRNLWKRFKDSVREKWSGPEKYIEPEAYSKTKQNYEKFFGEKPSKRYWG